MANEPVEPEASVTVTRDSTFARFYADNAAAFFLGRDVELSFTASSPTISSVRGASEAASSELDLEFLFVEVCRLRLPPQTAINTAFNIIFTLLQNDKLDVETLRTNVDNMIEVSASMAESTGKGDDE